MANTIKLKFPFDSRVANIPVNSKLMEKYKSQVKNGSNFGFSMSKSRFLDNNTCPKNNNADVSAWFYPQFKLMNFYAAKTNSHNISDCSDIDYASKALISYKEAENNYSDNSIEKEFINNMSKVLEDQIFYHYIHCNHEDSAETVRDPNKFYKTDEFGTTLSFTKSSNENSEWNKMIGAF